MISHPVVVSLLLDFLEVRRAGRAAALGVLEDRPDPDGLADAARLAARRPRRPRAHLAVARRPCIHLTGQKSNRG